MHAVTVGSSGADSITKILFSEKQSSSVPWKMDSGKMGHVPEKAGSNPISSMTVKRESIIRKKKPQTKFCQIGHRSYWYWTILRSFNCKFMNSHYEIN